VFGFRGLVLINLIRIITGLSRYSSKEREYLRIRIAIIYIFILMPIFLLISRAPVFLLVLIFLHNIIFICRSFIKNNVFIDIFLLGLSGFILLFLLYLLLLFMFNLGREAGFLIKSLLHVDSSLGVIREVAVPSFNKGTVSYILYEKSEGSHRLLNKKMGTFPVLLDRGTTRGRSSGFSCRDQSDQGLLSLVKRLLGRSQEKRNIIHDWIHRPPFNGTLPPLPVEPNYNIYIEINDITVPVEVEHNTYEGLNAYEKIRVYENAYERIRTYKNTYLTTNTLPVDSQMPVSTSSHDYVNFTPLTPVLDILPDYYIIRGSSFNNTRPRHSPYIGRTNSITISCDQIIFTDKLVYTSKI